VERLTSEQIRLLEELRELRDSGILTVDEFELQVAKVLGRPQAVQPSPVNEEPVVPDEKVAEEIPDEVMREEQVVVNGVPAASDETHESELLEYEFVEPNVSDEEEILAEENQGVEPSSTSDISAANIAESEIQQNKSSQRKILIGTTVSLALVAVIGLAALVGGGKSDPASTQIVDNTTTVTQSTAAVTTQAPTTSTTTTTEVIPTTTYEVLQCPYTRFIEAVDGKIVTPEGITFEMLPTTYKSVRSGDGYSVSVDKYVPYKFGDIEVTNSTNFRLRIGMRALWTWDEGFFETSWEPDNGRGWVNGFDSVTIDVPNWEIDSPIPVTGLRLEIISSTIKFLCP
jgi:hypothetical protein